MTDEFSGRCLCGDITYEAHGEPAITGQCHCEDCRRSSGTGHCSHLGMAEDAVKIRGTVAKYDKVADSGNMVTRAFCPNCGAPVYSINSGIQGMVFLRASSLDDLEIFKPQVVVYTEKAASWDKIDPALPSFEGMPPMG